MGERITRKLSFSRGLLLFVAVSLSGVAPNALGQATAGQTSVAPQAANADAATPAYDVASIKANKSGSGRMGISIQDESFGATNISFKLLLENAYGIREDLISGGPGWVNSAHFDIEAKIVDPNIEQMKKLSNEKRSAMLQPLLADRFQLKVHKETKELPVYDLVLVKNGPKFKASASEGASVSGDKNPNSVGRGGIRIQNDGHRVELTADAIPLANLVNMLSHELNRTVIDKTGLTGEYDLSLIWAPQDGPSQDEATDDSSASSIFTALQEQLGLKLQPSKGPVETLVIDHVEMPSEN